MPNYRKIETDSFGVEGEIKPQGEVKALYSKSTSFSGAVDTYADKGWEEITGVPMPAPSSPLKKIEAAAPVQLGGKLTEVWVENDLYSDYTDSDSVFHSKKEQEDEFILNLAVKMQLNIHQLKTRRLEGETTIAGKPMKILTALAYLQQAKGNQKQRSVLTRHGPLSMSGSDAVAALNTLDDFVQNELEDHAVALHNAIEAAKTDISALLDIDITSGWPTPIE